MKTLVDGPKTNQSPTEAPDARQNAAMSEAVQSLISDLRKSNAGFGRVGQLLAMTLALSPVALTEDCCDPNANPSPTPTDYPEPECQFDGEFPGGLFEADTLQTYTYGLDDHPVENYDWKKLVTQMNAAAPPSIDAFCEDAGESVPSHYTGEASCQEVAEYVLSDMPAVQSEVFDALRDDFVANFNVNQDKYDLSGFDSCPVDAEACDVYLPPYYYPPVAYSCGGVENGNVALFRVSYSDLYYYCTDNDIYLKDGKDVYAAFCITPDGSSLANTPVVLKANNEFDHLNGYLFMNPLSGDLAYQLYLYDEEDLYLETKNFSLQDYDVNATPEPTPSPEITPVPLEPCNYERYVANAVQPDTIAYSLGTLGKDPASYDANVLAAAASTDLSAHGEFGSLVTEASVSGAIANAYFPDWQQFDSFLKGFLFENGVSLSQAQSIDDIEGSPYNSCRIAVVAVPDGYCPNGSNWAVTQVVGDFIHPNSCEQDGITQAVDGFSIAATYCTYPDGSQLADNPVWTSLMSHTNVVIDGESEYIYNQYTADRVKGTLQYTVFGSADASWNYIDTL